MADLISSSSRRIPTMGSAGALSHAYIQYPPFRCNIPGSSGMMYDDGNKLLIVPSPSKVFSWPISRHAHADSPSITSVDEGPVLAARFSLDGKILAIQQSETEISFFNRENGIKFHRHCRIRTDKILGFFWTDCPTCNIVYVTTSGLELYSLTSGGDGLKLIEVKSTNVIWYLYTHESRLVLLASGMQCKTFICYQFSAGGIIRLPKFDVNLKKGEGNQKSILQPEDVHVATMYGRLYCLQVDKVAMELNIYRFYRDAVVHQGVVPIYSQAVAFSVVDNVLLVHQIAAKVVLLYDVFSDMKAPISAPLPLLLRGSSGYSDHEILSVASDSDGFRTPSESNIYADDWVFANPDIILDQANGILWRVYLDLEAITASSSDVASLLSFLQRRRLDTLKAKELSITVLRSIIVEKRPLTIISECIDVVNMAFAQSAKARSLSSSKHNSSRSANPTVKEQVEAVSAGTQFMSVEPSSSTKREIFEDSGNVGNDTAESHITADNDYRQTQADIIEGPVKVNDRESSSIVILSDNTAISPEECYQHVFMVIDEELAVEASFLSAAIIQYMRSAGAEKLKTPSRLQALLIQLLTRDERYPELAHFVHTKILEPSKEVATELVEAGKSCPLIATLGLNMWRQLSAHAEYLSILLENGRVLEALRYARQNRVEAVPPSTFLELAAGTKDAQVLASVLRFCLDFVPEFEKTSEYGAYTAILTNRSAILAG